jgi:hypothetical protein
MLEWVEQVGFSFFPICLMRSFIYSGRFPRVIFCLKHAMEPRQERKRSKTALGSMQLALNEAEQGLDASTATVRSIQCRTDAFQRQAVERLSAGRAATAATVISLNEEIASMRMEEEFLRHQLVAKENECLELTKLIQVKKFSWCN